MHSPPKIVFTAIAIALAWVSPCAAYSQASPTHVVANDAFTPFEQWKKAVVAGDAAALQALYLASPPAQITVAKKELTASDDVNFWIAMKARSVKADILDTRIQEPDIRTIVFQIEIQASAPANETLYVSEAQSWLQQGGQWKLAAVQRTGAAHLQQPVSQDKDLYPSNVDAHAELKEAEQKATQEHKRVLVVFGANWCYDCHVLDLAFHRPDFAGALVGYEVVHVDIGDDGKKNNDVAKDCDVPLNKGIPALAVLDGSGKLLVSQKNGEFENARAMTPQGMLEFLNKWKP
jgi:hypothetical protein